MSEQPQGPGWWLASDGRYYPPQPVAGEAPQQPAPVQPQQPQPQQPYGQPPYGPPQQPYGQPPQYVPQQPAGGGYPQQFVAPTRRGGTKVLAVVLVVVVLVVAVPAVAIWWFFHRVSDKVTELTGAGGCTIVSDDTAADALGAPIKLLKGTGLGGLVGGAIDSRVLPGAPDCWGSTTSASGDSSLGGRLVRIALKEGGDAKATFVAEVRKAKGGVVSSSEGVDGGSTTVESSGYYGAAVSGLGDEAFCTGVGLTGTVGVLVRSGDKLVFASVGADLSKLGTPDPANPADLLNDGGAGCEKAQKLARAVLG